MSAPTKTPPKKLGPKGGSQKQTPTQNQVKEYVKTTFVLVARRTRPKMSSNQSKGYHADRYV